MTTATLRDDMGTTWQSPGAVQPDPQARHLADEMLAMREVMGEILGETIPHPDEDDVTVHESGRTLCGQGSTIHGPLARFPTAVELAECPRNVRGGTWHTHVTKDQLRNPTNSLPDTANVIFGQIDVSAVVGTQQTEVVMAAANREDAKQTFQDAIGVEAESTEDVIDAIIQGRLTAPSDARRRVRQRLGPLFESRPVNFRDLDRRLDVSGIPANSVTPFELIEARQYAHVAQTIRASHHRKNPVRDPVGVRKSIRGANWRAKEAASGSTIGQYAMRSAVGTAVSAALRSLF